MPAIAVPERLLQTIHRLETANEPIEDKLSRLLESEIRRRLAQYDLYNYVLVLSRQRLYGRDCEGGAWHRHPHHDPDIHDVSTEGSRPVSPEEFLVEVEQVLAVEGIL